MQLSAHSGQQEKNAMRLFSSHVPPAMNFAKIFLYDYLFTFRKNLDKKCIRVKIEQLFIFSELLLESFYNPKQEAQKDGQSYDDSRL